MALRERNVLQQVLECILPCPSQELLGRGACKASGLLDPLYCSPKELLLPPPGPVGVGPSQFNLLSSEVVLLPPSRS